jgi:hypothetical protein
MGTVPTAANAAEAIAMIRAGPGFLATADATQMPTEVQAQCLIALERADAMSTAARASILAAYTASQGYREDGDYSARSWLIHKTGVTKATATEHTGWSHRTHTHPRIIAALATEDISKSYARTICTWTTSSPTTAATPPMRSWSAPRRWGWHCRTWPPSPPRSRPGPAPTCRMRTGRGSRTGP